MQKRCVRILFMALLLIVLGSVPAKGAESSGALLRIVFVGWDQSIFGTAYPILNKYNATAYFHPSEYAKRKVGLTGCLTTSQFDHLLQSGWCMLDEYELASETSKFEELSGLNITLNDFQSERLLIIVLYYLAERGGQLTLFLNGVIEQEYHLSLCPSKIFELVIKTAANLGLQVGEGVGNSPPESPSPPTP